MIGQSGTLFFAVVVFFFCAVSAQTQEASEWVNPGLRHDSNKQRAPGTTAKNNHVPATTAKTKRAPELLLSLRERVFFAVVPAARPRNGQRQQQKRQQKHRSTLTLTESVSQPLSAGNLSVWPGFTAEAFGFSALLGSGWLGLWGFGIQRRSLGGLSPGFWRRRNSRWFPALFVVGASTPENALQKKCFILECKETQGPIAAI